MYPPILRIHLKKISKDSSNDAYAMLFFFMCKFFLSFFFLQKHILWVLIRITSTSLCNSNGYPQHLSL